MIFNDESVLWFKTLPAEERIEIAVNFSLLMEFLVLAYGGGIVAYSGYRSPLYNESVGGSLTSKHLKGLAVDAHVRATASLMSRLLSSSRSKLVELLELPRVNDDGPLPGYSHVYGYMISGPENGWVKVHFEVR